MSATVPVPYIADFGPMIGRGEVEAHILQTLSAFIVTYVAAYERAYGLVPRSIPIPPTLESVHGGLDFETWESGLSPELIVVTQPVGDVERDPDSGYGQWFQSQVGAVVYVEGDQDGARRLADIYGTLLQALLVQQGAFGLALDGENPFATRTRLASAPVAAFLDDNVRDIIREVVTIRTFVTGLANDLDGPRTPSKDPYGTPLLWPGAKKIRIDITGEETDGTPSSTNKVVIDGTTIPTTITYD